MKKYLLLLICTVCLSSLTGCWSYREIDKLSFVSGVAIDKDGPGKYELTAEIIDVDTSGTNAKFNSLTLNSKGESIFDCNRNMISVSAKKLYWGHATTVIISEDVARSGLLPILDWILRDSEPRLDLYLFIANTNKAKDILSLKPVSTEIVSFEMSTIVESSKKSSTIPTPKVYELVNQISKIGIYPVIPTVEEVFNEGIKTMKITGGAIFKNDKLVSFLNENDIKPYLLATDDFDSGVLVFSLDDKQTENVTLEVFNTNTKVKPKFHNNELTMEVNVSAETFIGEIDTYLDVFKEENILNIKRLAEKKVKKDILDLVRKTQKEDSLDIFGFGENIKRNMPSLWKEIEYNWESIYKDLKVDIKADVKIKSSGHFSKTLNSD